MASDMELDAPDALPSAIVDKIAVDHDVPKDALRLTNRRLRDLLNSQQQTLLLTPQNCWRTSGDAARLRARFPAARVLHCKEWNFDSMSDREVLSQLLVPWPGIEKITVMHHFAYAHAADERMAECLAHLRDHPTLSSAAFSMRLDGVAISHLATCTALTQLQAFDGIQRSTTSSMPQLLELTSIRTLAPLTQLAPGLTSLAFNDSYGDGIAAIEGHTALARLQWTSAQLTPGNAAILPSVAKTLRHLAVEANDFLAGGAFLECLGSLSRLTELRLRPEKHCLVGGVTGADMSALLLLLPRLQQLQLIQGHQITDACLPELAACTSLRALHLAHCKRVTSKGVRALAEALKAAPQSRQLEVVIADMRFSPSHEDEQGDEMVRRGWRAAARDLAPVLKLSIVTDANALHRYCLLASLSGWGW